MNDWYSFIRVSNGSIFFILLSTATCWLTRRQIFATCASNFSFLSIVTPSNSTFSFKGMTVFFWSFFQCALDLRGSLGFFCRGILRLSSIILNSPFEYDVILTFVRAHEELVYFIRSWARWPKTAVIPGQYLIAFVDLVPIATEKVSRIRSNIIWDRWKSTLKERSTRVNLNQGTEM